MRRSNKGHVQLSKSEKNIGAVGWRLDHLFQSADLGVGI